MKEPTNIVQDPTQAIPAATPPTRRLKWRERHKKVYQCLMPITGLLLGFALGIAMLMLLMGPVTASHKVSGPTLLGLAFIAAGITWVGGFLGAAVGYLALIAEKLLADDSKTARS